MLDIQSRERFIHRPMRLIHHRHGGLPEADMERLGISGKGPILDFSTNLSPLGLPEVVREACVDLPEALTRYPSPDGRLAAKYYERRFGLSPECVLPGNGSLEMIYLVPRALGLKRAAVVSPSFYDYERALKLAGAQTERVSFCKEDGFAPLPAETLARALSKNDALVLGNPNNPTGTRFSASDLLDSADRFPNKYILADEAFIQFSDDPRAASLLYPDRIRRNIVVFHSLTKIYAIPGIRIGAAIGHPETVSILRRCAIPWSVNAAAEKIAASAACCDAYEAAVRDLVAAERARIRQAVGAISGLELFDTASNFFLAAWRHTKDLDDLLRALLKEGLYVRDCRNFAGLEDQFFRFCIKRPEENDRLIRALLGATRD
jgi:threonine-phosphate decarboxylase